MKKLILFALLITYACRSNAQTITLSLITTPCDSNGIVVATCTGFTPPYNVYWDESGITFNHTGVTGTTDTFYGFVGGGISATGYGGGVSTPYPRDSITVNAPFTVSVTATPALCPTLGTLSAAVTGGTGPFTYKWENASTSTVIGTANPISITTTGYYLIRVTDVGTGCIAGFSSPIYLNITPDFTATVTTTTANCTNGTAFVAMTGGTGPFSYLWSNGANTDTITGLVTGSYFVSVTDAHGCTNSPALYGYVSQAIPIGAYTTPTPATCADNNGSVTAFGSGGTPPYSYLWNTGATTVTISGLAPNYYNVAVTDVNGCIGGAGTTLTASTPITVTYSTTPSSCTTATGSCTLTITGGSLPYSVQFYSSPIQATATPSGLAPGNYYFTVTDAVGCTQSGTVTIPPVDAISLSFTATAATCIAADGAVSVSASGGVAPYTYSWSTGATTAGLVGVPYGNYTTTVTDANGCTATNCHLVPYTSPIELGLSSTDASCLYTHDGTITATASLGTPPYIYSTGGSSSGSVTIPGLATGSYWIYVTDAIGCNTWEYTYVDYNVSDSSCFCVVKGTVYDDINHNCIQDAGEPAIQNIQLQASGFGYTYTNPAGDYYFLLPSGTYTVAQTVLHMYPLSPCQPNNIPYTSVAATGCNTTINFADTLDPIHDMHISTWDYTAPPRPGFPYTQVSVITNDGTVTEPNILAGYNPDGQIYGPSFVPLGIFTGAPYYYNTAGSSFTLTPGAGQQFLINYNVPADIPLGTNVIFKDSVAYTSPMTNWLSDYSPWNNINYFTTTTVGSYDPNFKEVSPKGWDGVGMITTDDSVLEYMVHFQNTGSYMAENVVVKDTLDPNLNWASLKPVYMSDKCVVKMDDNGHVTFTFNNIDLPASSSEPITSNAMFTYTVKLRPGLSLGTQIKNRGSIYFDFNAPILTNQTLNTIGWPEHTPSVAATANGNNTFTIYPNPAQNTFNAIINIDNSGTYNLTVCDVTGKTDISKTLTLQKGSQNVTVDAARLAPGVYFVTLKGDDNKTQTQKLVILK